MSKILFRKPFIEALEELEKDDKEKIFKKVDFVYKKIFKSDFSNIVKLKKFNLFRFREGKFRIIFDYGENNDGEIIMDIFFVAPRDYVYDILKRVYKLYRNSEIFEDLWKTNDEEKNISEKDFKNTYEPKYRNILASFIEDRHLAEFEVNAIIQKCKEQIFDLNETSNNILNSLLKNIKEDVVIINGSPGTGKSLLIFNLATKLIKDDKFTLIIVPTKNLKEEFYLKKFDNYKINYVSLNNNSDFYNDFKKSKLAILTYSEFISIIYEGIDLGQLNITNKKIIEEILTNIVDYKNKELISLSPEDIYFMYLIYQSGLIYKTSERYDYLFQSIKEIYDSFIKSKLLKEIENKIKRTPISILKNINLSKVSSQFPPNINLLVDEAQEFFIRENEFLYDFWYKCKNNERLISKPIILYTGDIFQRSCITDFRFDELKTLIYEKSKNRPKEYSLDQSFRVPMEIADYAKKYSDFFLEKYPNIRHFPVIDPQKCIKSCYLNYQIPIKGTINDLINGFQNIKNINGKKLVVICSKQDEEKISKLREQFNFIVPVPIEFVKGLEFQNVLVYNIFFNKKEEFNFEEISKIYLSLTRSLESIVHFVEYKREFEGYFNMFSFNSLSKEKLSTILENLLSIHRKDQELILIRNILESLENRFSTYHLSYLLQRIIEYTKEPGYDTFEVPKIIRELISICEKNDYKLSENIEFFDIPDFIKALIYYESGNYIEALILFFEIDKNMFIEKMKECNFSFFEKLKLLNRANNDKLKKNMREIVEKEMREKNIDIKILDYILNYLKLTNDINEIFFLFIVTNLNLKTKVLVELWK